MFDLVFLLKHSFIFFYLIRDTDSLSRPLGVAWGQEQEGPPGETEVGHGNRSGEPLVHPQSHTPQRWRSEVWEAWCAAREYLCKLPLLGTTARSLNFTVEYQAALSRDYEATLLGSWVLAFWSSSPGMELTEHHSSLPDWPRWWKG